MGKKAPSKSGPDIISAMAETVTLDSFFDKNPFRIKPANYPAYVKQAIELNRAERARWEKKEESK